MTSSRCPICRRPTELAYRPFCSKRCADLDLARWFRGDYAIPAEEQGESDPATPEGDDRD